MAPSPALKLIAKERGCSAERARRFCSKVRRYCDGEEPDSSEILGVLRALGSEGSRSGYHSVAKAIEEGGAGGAGPGKKSREGAQIRRFEGPSGHGDFIDWVDHNGEDGFVLNARGKSEAPILHLASCSALKPDPETEKCATASAKLCSTSRSALRRKGQNLADGRLQRCQQCGI